MKRKKNAEMTKQGNERIIIEVIRSSINNQRPQRACESVEECCCLMETAQSHKLLPIVVDGVYNSGKAKTWSELAQYRRIVHAQVLQQVQRGTEFLEAYRKLEEADIRVLVVKGCMCRAVWPKGDLRISGDEDVYVRDADFGKACEALKECGLVCDERADPEKDFEIGWRKPNSTLYIELHRRLFAPRSAAADLQSFFGDAFERAQEYDVEHGTAKVWSMSPEDHLL